MELNVLGCQAFFFTRRRRAPRATLFPYTTLFRSVRGTQPGGGAGLAPVAAAARPDGDAPGARPAGRRPLSGRAAALRAARLFPLPVQHAARAGGVLNR